MSYYEIALRASFGVFFFGWGSVFMYHIYMYCYGDKSLAPNLIDNLSKNPSWVKQNIALQIGAGGAFLLIYSVTYPLCRHRRKNKSLSFDLFMWMNWLWFMVIIFMLLNEDLVKSYS